MENLQQVFFQHIKQKLPAHLSSVDEVAAILNISNDSAYRRIRNEKSISFEEIQKLAAHFKISIDQVLNLETDTGSFSGKYVKAENFDFSSYLEQSYKDLAFIASFKEKELIFLSKDVPFFYYYAFPELAAFKYFIWMKTLLNFPQLVNVPFSFDYLMKPLIEIGEKVICTYNKLPGTEIMNVENINTTLRQIEYYKETFMFSSKEVVEKLYQQLHELTNHLCNQAEEGFKFLPGQKPNSQSAKYKLYVNDFVIGDNSVIGVFDNNKASFITHSHLNYIMITDPKFTSYHYSFVQNIIKKSILISEVGEKYRARFFHIIHDKIEQCRKDQMPTVSF